MTRRQGRILVAAFVALLVVLVGGHALVMLYTDALWYNAIGYSAVFWKRLLASLVARSAGMVVGGGVVLLNLGLVVRRLGGIHLRRRYGNLEISEQVPRRYLITLAVLASLLAGWWLAGLDFGGEAGIAALAWLRHVPWGTADPMFGKDIGFFVFSFPVYERIVDFLLLTVLWSAILAMIGYTLLGMLRWEERKLFVAETARVHLVGLAAAVVLLLAVRFWLDRYGVLLAGTSNWVGYSDIRARLPAFSALAGLAIVATVALFYSGWRARWVPGLAALGLLVVGAIVLEQLYPYAVQKLRVEPNQLKSETPYIQWSLNYTRRAYGLGDLVRTRTPYRPSLPSWDTMAARIGRIARWDPEPLGTNFNQAETFYTYYHFPDVDFDRYGRRGDEQPVAIAVRELEASSLPAQKQTWQSLHLNSLYMRGWGAVVVPVAKATKDGEPTYWLDNMNPFRRSAAAPASISLSNPSVYFGESTRDYAVIIPGRDTAFTGRPGRDYPAGVRLSSLPRLLAFAWRFGEKNLLFSSELNDSSRIVFRRSVVARVRALARWVIWDNDPYPVLHDGHVVWIVDGYTASGTYPLSRAVDMPGVGRIRYIRNSVKATVDAVTGTVRLYALDPRDPVLRTFERVFPHLVQPLDQMPEELRAHLRYPVTLLRVQAGILEQYHLVRPDNFFAGQDLWAVAQEAGAEGVPRPYVPTYMLAPLPGDSISEFLLMIPFVARERHNMTALLVARSDPPHYGQIELLELPRDQQVPGPTQVHSLIEQDPIISQQLSLWRQAGSDVDVGHLRVLPVDSGLLYMVPLFISARETPLTTLARVVVSDGHQVAMDSTFERAVLALHQGSTTASAPASPGHPSGAPVSASQWPSRALDMVRQAESQLRAGNWTGFGQTWSQLKSFLESVQKPRPTPPDTGATGASHEP